MKDTFIAARKMTADRMGKWQVESYVRVNVHHIQCFAMLDAPNEHGQAIFEVVFSDGSKAVLEMASKDLSHYCRS